MAEMLAYETLPAPWPAEFRYRSDQWSVQHGYTIEIERVENNYIEGPIAGTAHEPIYAAHEIVRSSLVRFHCEHLDNDELAEALVEKLELLSKERVTND